MLFKEVKYLGKDSYILELINGRVLKLLTNTTSVKVVTNSRWITELNLSSIDKKEYLNISLQKCIDLFKTNGESELFTRFCPQVITELDKFSFKLESDKETKATFFLLPLLEENKDFFCYNSFFINCYLGVKSNKFYDWGEHLFLTYRFVKDNLMYMELEKRLKNHPLFEKMIQTGFHHDTFMFEIPENFELDIKAFIHGEYSTFSESLKQKILKFHNQSKSGKIGRILYKDPKLREQLEMEFAMEIKESLELYDIPRKIQETFYY